MRSFAQTYGFHPFFRVGDVRKVLLNGCGAEVDFTRGNDGVRDPGARRYRLTDPVLGRVLTLEAEGNAQVIVWNGCRGDPPRANVSPDEWGDFVCVEPVVLDARSLLTSGGTCELSLSISVQKITSGREGK